MHILKAEHRNYAFGPLYLKPNLYFLADAFFLLLWAVFFPCASAGVIVLLSLAFLMPAFYYIPKASLAAVIICAVAPMVDYRVVIQMWRIHSKSLIFSFIGISCMVLSVHLNNDVWSTGLDLLPFLATFLLSFWQVQYGIIGGVAVSGALLLYTMARPKIKVWRHYWEYAFMTNIWTLLSLMKLSNS